MNLGFYPIASSSKGNSYLIRSEETAILLDAGVSGTRINKALEQLNLSTKRVKGLLITHEHIDHMQGASRVLSFCHHCDLYCSKGTMEATALKFERFEDSRKVVVASNETFMIGDIEVTAFELSHDASEPLAYTFKKNGKKIAVVTDTGKFTKDMDDAIADSDILVIESNHEVNILLYGRYPYHVKHRILSDVGHISNEVCGEAICRFLENQKEEKIPLVFLAHLSKENNTPQQAMLTVGNILEEHDFYVGKNLKMEVLAPEGESQYIVI